MRFTKVKVSFRPAPNRLYRVLLVPENTDLLRLAQIIGESLHVAWDHMFQFRKGDTNYVLNAEEDFSGIFSGSDSVSMRDHGLSVLGQKAVFEYDFGDGWEFNVQIYKRAVEREENYAWILEGKGQGIWEDAIGSVYAYLFGEIDDDTEPEDSPFMLPWNFENTSFSDFDRPLDLESEQCHLDSRLIHELSFDDDEEEDDAAEILQSFMDATDGMDCLGMDQKLHQWVLQALEVLEKKYDATSAEMLVMRMLLVEESRLGEGE